jgi:hypothetical protein
MPNKEYYIENRKDKNVLSIGDMKIDICNPLANWISANADLSIQELWEACNEPNWMISTLLHYQFDLPETVVYEILFEIVAMSVHHVKKNRDLILDTLDMISQFLDGEVHVSEINNVKKLFIGLPYNEFNTIILMYINTILSIHYIYVYANELLISVLNFIIFDDDWGQYQFIDEVKEIFNLKCEETKFIHANVIRLFIPNIAEVINV